MEMTAKLLRFRGGYHLQVKAQSAEDQVERSLRWLLWGSGPRVLWTELSLIVHDNAVAQTCEACHTVDGSSLHTGG